MELSQESAPATPAPGKSLKDEIKEALMAHWSNVSHEDAAAGANMVLQLLMDRGHVLPGAPPAQQIMEDAKSFAFRLTLSNLTVRIIAMLYTTGVETPESKPAKRWIGDYLDGKNHGPVGHPMLWPGKLPGMCSLLRDWGYVPTIALPGQPSYVAKPLPNPTPN